MIKIAISGKARTGKNTLATMLVKYFNCNEETAKIVALADPIKNMVLHIFPNANRECLFGPSELRSNIIDNDLFDLVGRPLTYRQVLIDFGTLGRQYNPDVWLNALAVDAKKTINKKLYILSDVRYPNEVDFFKRENFYMIRIKRKDIPLINDLSELGQDQISDDEFDTIIHNDSSLNELEDKAKQLVKLIHNSVSKI